MCGEFLDREGVGQKYQMCYGYVKVGPKTCVIFYKQNVYTDTDTDRDVEILFVIFCVEFFVE